MDSNPLSPTIMAILDRIQALMSATPSEATPATEDPQRKLHADRTVLLIALTPTDATDLEAGEFEETQIPHVKFSVYKVPCSLQMMNQLIQAIVNGTLIYTATESDVDLDALEGAIAAAILPLVQAGEVELVKSRGRKEKGAAIEAHPSQP
jgi:hypothetical protein